MKPRHAGFLLISVLSTAFLGCERQGNPGSLVIPEDQQPILGQYEQAGVRLDLTIEPREVLVGQPITLTLVVRAPASVRVQFPVISDELGPFLVREVQAPPLYLDPDSSERTTRRIYLLETYLAGEAEIPPLNFKIIPAGLKDIAEDEESHTLVTEPFLITVRSALQQDQASAEFAAPGDPLDIPIPRGPGFPWGKVVMLLLMIAAIACAVVMVIRRFARKRPAHRLHPVAMSPHAWALHQLLTLESARLPEKGTHDAMHEYFVRLSDIVRQYIERRFGLMAPERTTEEFLHIARISPALFDHQKDMLVSFLRSADMVKFALHTPAIGDAVAAMSAAREFVDQTTPAESAQNVNLKPTATAEAIA